MRFLHVRFKASLDGGLRDFPGGPVVETLRLHCRGHVFDPWLGNLDPACRTVAKKRWWSEAIWWLSDEFSGLLFECLW